MVVHEIEIDTSDDADYIAKDDLLIVTFSDESLEKIVKIQLIKANSGGFSSPYNPAVECSFSGKKKVWKLQHSINHIKKIESSFNQEKKRTRYEIKWTRNVKASSSLWRWWPLGPRDGAGGGYSRQN